MPVYLDHNATTPLDGRVLDAMLPFLRGQYGNPSSSHQLGRTARTAIETAREQIAALVNATPGQIIFTSGGTEANNLAIKGALAAFPSGRIAISAIEHASLRGPAQAMTQQAYQLDSIAVDAQGSVLLDAVRQSLHTDTRLISVMLANNETGAIQDIAGIAALARQAGAIMHTDAVQALGKIKIDFAASGAHLMSLSAHKIYGPKGIGALVVDESVSLETLLHGGGHEQGRRAGTENVAAIAGFGAAAELARQELEERQAHWGELSPYLEKGLRTFPGAVVFAEKIPRLSNTVLVSLPGFAGETLLMNLDKAGIMVSSGSACLSGSLSASPVLRAMGIEPRLLRNVLRISLGKASTPDELDLLLTTLQTLHKQFAPWEVKTGNGI
ncbi:MAG: cysteine desulfurase family protein [Gammaproteobacteria bacterium]